jgi:hypothetical protein
VPQPEQTCWSAAVFAIGATVLAAPDDNCADTETTRPRGRSSNLEPVSRRKLRSQREVLEQASSLRAELQAALDRLPSGDPAVIDAVWAGEGLGTLFWALQLVELPPYDRPFDPQELAAVEPSGDVRLRDAEEIELEREAARLWHWRARTTELQRTSAESGRTIELPERYASFDQLVAATAMRGFEQGVLPQPMRGDFRAYDKVYRHLSPEQHAEAHSLASERHQALNWLCGDGESWHDVPLDT